MRWLPVKLLARLGAQVLDEGRGHYCHLCLFKPSPLSTGTTSSFPATRLWGHSMPLNPHSPGIVLWALQHGSGPVANWLRLKFNLHNQTEFLKGDTLLQLSVPHAALYMDGQ